MDGSVGYDHKRFKRVLREFNRGNNHVAVGLILDHLIPQTEDADIPYSEMQLAARKYAKKTQRTLKRVVTPLPIPSSAKVAIAATPTVVDMWSRGVGSYDMRTPDVQRYEESVTFGGSGGMII